MQPAKSCALFGALILLTALASACNLTPRLTTSADDLGGEALTTGAITLRNAGAGQLRWTATTDNPYVLLGAGRPALTASGSVAAGDSFTLWFEVDGTISDPSEPLNALLNISSNGGSRQVPLLFGATGLCRALPAGALGDAPAGGPRPVGSEILVTYYAPASLGSQSLARLAGSVRLELSAAHGLTTLEAGDGAQPDLLRAPPGRDVDALVAALAADPRVRNVQRNYYLELLQVPPDPFYRSQWALSDFGIEQAWAALAAPERDVVLAVIDSGFDTGHPDLAGKLLPGYDFFRNSATVDPPLLKRGADSFGATAHGTHVAGIAAAGRNGVGIMGVAFDPSVKLLPIKLFDDCGVGSPVGSVDALVKAIRWAAGLPVTSAPPNPHPAHVINMSLGVPGSHPVLDEATTAAWTEAGALLVAAAGNSGSSLSPSLRAVISPANGPNVMAVGSVDQSRVRSGFSSYGAGLDIVAPGGYAAAGTVADGVCLEGSTILSAVPYDRNEAPELGYGCMAGTSMAAPYVAGVAALLMAQDAGLSAAGARQALLDTALLEAHMLDAQQYGRGLVCADRALGAPSQCGGPAH